MRSAAVGRRAVHLAHQGQHAIDVAQQLAHDLRYLLAVEHRGQLAALVVAPVVAAFALLRFEKAGEQHVVELAHGGLDREQRRLADLLELRGRGFRHEGIAPAPEVDGQDRRIDRQRRRGPRRGRNERPQSLQVRAQGPEEAAQLVHADAEELLAEPEAALGFPGLHDDVRQLHDGAEAREHFLLFRRARLAQLEAGVIAQVAEVAADGRGIERDAVRGVVSAERAQCVVHLARAVASGDRERVQQLADIGLDERHQLVGAAAVAGARIERANPRECRGLRGKRLRGGHHRRQRSDLHRLRRPGDGQRRYHLAVDLLRQRKRRGERRDQLGAIVEVRREAEDLRADGVDVDARDRRRRRWIRREERQRTRARQRGLRQQVEELLDVRHGQSPSCGSYEWERAA